MNQDTRGGVLAGNISQKKNSNQVLENSFPVKGNSMCKDRQEEVGAPCGLSVWRDCDAIWEVRLAGVCAPCKNVGIPSHSREWLKGLEQAPGG